MADRSCTHQLRALANILCSDDIVAQGSPLNRANLRAVKVNKCHMCVILTTHDGITDDPTLVDKEAILCSLNVKTMTFQARTNLWNVSGSGTTFTLSLLREGLYLQDRCRCLYINDA